LLRRLLVGVALHQLGFSVDEHLHGVEARFLPRRPGRVLAALAAAITPGVISFGAGFGLAVMNTSPMWRCSREQPQSFGFLAVCQQTPFMNKA
jgi:hypothetical protein